MNREKMSQHDSNKFDLELEFEYSKKPNYYLYFAVFLVNISAFVAGIGIAWPSSGIPRLKGTHDPANNPLSTSVTPFEESMLGSLSPLTACIGPIIFGITADRLGRKKTMILIMVPITFSFLIKIFADKVIYFLIARLLLGLGTGGVFGVISIYVGELSEVSNRGALGCFLPGFCAAGILFSYVIGAYLSIKWFSFVAIVISVTFFPLVMIFVPESPHYLVMKNCEDVAFQALKLLRTCSKQSIMEELSGIRDFVQESFMNKLQITDVFKSKGLRMAFIINISLMVAQQGAGITAILTYLMTIFESSGTTISSDISTIAIGVIQLLASLLTPLVIDKLGRRILLILSSIFCTLSLSTLSLYLLLYSYGYETSSYSWIPIATLIVYMFAFCTGFGPLPWVILGEMFPPNAKALASMIVTFSSSFLAFLTALAYPYIATYIGISQSFWLFTFCSLSGGIFVYFYLPETKERTLHEIQIMLNS